MLFWSIVNGLIVLMVVGMMLSVLFFMIQYVMILKVWEKW